MSTMTDGKKFTAESRCWSCVDARREDGSCERCRSRTASMIMRRVDENGVGPRLRVCSACADVRDEEFGEISVVEEETLRPATCNTCRLRIVLTFCPGNDDFEEVLDVESIEMIDPERQHVDGEDKLCDACCLRESVCAAGVYDALGLEAVGLPTKPSRIELVGRLQWSRCGEYGCDIEETFEIDNITEETTP